MTTDGAPAILAITDEDQLKQIEQFLDKLDDADVSTKGKKGILAARRIVWQDSGTGLCRKLIDTIRRGWSRAAVMGDHVVKLEAKLNRRKEREMGENELTNALEELESVDPPDMSPTPDPLLPGFSAEMESLWALAGKMARPRGTAGDQRDLFLAMLQEHSHRQRVPTLFDGIRGHRHVIHGADQDSVDGNQAEVPDA
jgi:hypothetical protein